MYNRLFTKILDSSIWLEADTTRLVWITLLAAMDEDGFAPFSSVENLSRRANIPLEATVTAVTILEAPDKFNPNDEFEGRRIERMENGWMVLKAPLYRSLLTREIQREQTRLRVAKHREKQKAVTIPALPNVTGVSCNTSEHSIAEHIRAKQSSTTPLPPSKGDVLLQRVRGFFNKRDSTPLDAAEKTAWKKAKESVEATSEKDWQLLEWVYAQRNGDPAQFRRHDMATLLNNWNGQIERAKAWKHPGKVTSHDDSEKPTRGENAFKTYG